MLLWLAALPALADNGIATVGVLKAAAADSGCRQAWLLGTDPAAPLRFCIAVSALDAAGQALLAAHQDEEVYVEGRYLDGAVGLTTLSTDLTGHNGARPALDYHLSPLRGDTRSHNIGARLRESDVPRIRVQTPPHALDIELIVQGISRDASVSALLEALRIETGDGPLVPQVSLLGSTLILRLPAVPGSQLLTIESQGGGGLGALIGELYGEDKSQLSITMLLEPMGG